MAIKFESPIVLPPESVSKTFVIREPFELKQSFAIAVQLYSNFTPKTSNQIDKGELAFSIFLTDAEDAHTFGASAGRCGWCDYSTKGEIAEGIMNNKGKKLSEITTSGDVMLGPGDLLLDHVYLEDEKFLVRNQQPGIKSIFSLMFISDKTFFNEINDKFGNLYYDKITDADGKVIDFLSGELKSIDDYQTPVLVHFKSKTGEDIFNVFDFIFEDEPIDITNMGYLTFRILFENYGSLFTLEIMRPGENFYRPCISKQINHNLYGNNNLRFGFGQFTPLFSYDTNKIVDFNYHIIQIQQTID